MAQAGEGMKVITLGSKGTPLTSAAVFAIASASAHVRVDSSALDRLVSSKIIGIDSNLSTLVSLMPKIEDVIEHRATLVLLLSNLLRLSTARVDLLTSIVDALNSRDLTPLNCVSLTKEECDIVEKCGAEFSVICAIVETSLTSLAALCSAIAALSCEALKGNMSAVFDLSDKGDGLVNKERLGVASDLKVLLNGSKLVGTNKNDVFSQIPTVIGYLKETVKIVHSKARVELNSFNEGSRETAAKSASLVIEPVLFPLKELAENSVIRLKMNLNAIGDAACKSDLLLSFEKCTPEIDSIDTKCKNVCLSYIEKDYERFLHSLKDLLGTVWKIVTWEGIFALFAIENGELLGAKVDEDKEANTKVDKKKKKKTVLGKGTNNIVNWINEKVLNSVQENEISSRTKNIVLLLETFFDPKAPILPEFIAQLKEFLQSNESRRLPKIPKGTRDFSKEQMAIRERAFTIITQVFKRHGATALDTPAFELRETLTGKYGEDSKLIYDLADQGGELCSLRYDLTVPFARHVAMNGLTNFKRYQIAKVYRRDNPSKGRHREFYQCDLDIAGNYTKMGPDFEIIKILTELLDELNIGNYEVKLNHRKLLDGMLEICGVPNEKFRAICSSIDKLDKQSFDQVKKEMVEEKGISEEVADKIGVFVKEKGNPHEVLAKLKQQGSEFMQNGASKSALEDLEILFEALKEAKCIDKVVFDLSLARGLDYYTGVIFESVFNGSEQVGSIAAGGRYDGLIGMFGAKQVPAVGVSLGIERVFAIMEHERNENVRATETQVLLSVLGNESKLGLCAKMAGQLWDAKVKTEYEISSRFSKHMDRAKDGKIPLMVVVGDKEIEKGVFKLKDLESSLEEELPLDAFVHLVKSRLPK